MNLYIATGNPHKLREIREAVAAKDIQVRQVEADIHEIDAPDTKTVARRKVLDAFDAAKVDSTLVVDDTGLYIDALDGFPAAQASFFLERCGMEGILRLMAEEDSRDAHFKTSMAIYQPEKDETTLLNGVCQGRISMEARGDAGFGYDPIFIPEGHDMTFAEDPEYKMQVSHRKKVTDKLVEWLETVRPSSGSA